MGQELDITRGVDIHFPRYTRPEGWGQVYRDLWLVVGEQLATMSEEEVPDEALRLIDQAACFTAERFRGKKKEFRHSGDHVMVHFLVALQEYLEDGNFDLEESLALVLHDVLEDTVRKGDGEAREWEQVLQEITAFAGQGVGRMIVVLTKLRSGGLDRRNYDYIDTAQHLTNRQLIETLLDENGKVTEASLAFARKVWRVKAYDIRHNLRTIHHHTHNDGTANITKQLAKARLARDYQVPILYALGLENEARLIEDLVMGIITPESVNVAMQRRAVYEADEYLEAVRKWWGGILVTQPALGEGVIKLQLPRLHALQGEDWQEVLPKLVMVLEADQAREWWMALSTQYPVISSGDQPAFYRESAEPWVKVVSLANGQQLAIEMWTEKIMAERDKALMALFADKLSSVGDREDPAAYVRLAAELMNRYSQVPSIEINDMGGRPLRINAGSRVLDLIFAVEGLEGLRRVTQVLVERAGSRGYLDVDAVLQSGDTLVSYGLGPVHKDICLLEKLDSLSKRHSSGAFISLLSYLYMTEAQSVTEREVYNRGYQILAWLYAQLRGKSLDIYPVLVLGDEFTSLLYTVGSVKRRAGNEQDFKEWMEVMGVYKQSGVLPSGDDGCIVQAILAAGKLIEKRAILPTLRVQLPSDRPNVIEIVGSIMKEQGVSAMPFRGETWFDPNSPTATGAVLEIVLREEDMLAMEALVVRLEEAFHGAMVTVTKTDDFGSTDVLRAL